MIKQVGIHKIGNKSFLHLEEEDIIYNKDASISITNYEYTKEITPEKNKNTIGIKNFGRIVGL